ncbi:hypothetical protein HAX54_037223, partial [Datura stramonium]|nr:hypothetical protein [Datura stramonium]
LTLVEVSFKEAVYDNQAFSDPWVGIANYLHPLISDLGKEKMEDLLENYLFNEGMHTTALAEILIGQGIQLSLYNNKELMLNRNFQWTQEDALELSIQRESPLETDLQ